MTVCGKFETCSKWLKKVIFAPDIQKSDPDIQNSLWGPQGQNWACYVSVFNIEHLYYYWKIS